MESVTKKCSVLKAEFLTRNMSIWQVLCCQKMVRNFRFSLGGSTKTLDLVRFCYIGDGIDKLLLSYIEAPEFEVDPAKQPWWRKISGNVTQRKKRPESSVNDYEKIFVVGAMGV